MKKIILAATVFLMALSIQAQDLPEDSFRGNSQFLQPGISLGYYGYGFTGSRTGFSIPLSLVYEKDFGNNLSGGGFAGYARYAYQGTSDYKYSWTFMNFGIRASYHYIPFLNDALDMDIDSEKYDFYLTLMLFFENRSFNATDDYYEGRYDNKTTGGLGSVAGFRYHLSDSWSLFFEGGRGTFGYGTFGVTAYF